MIPDNQLLCEDRELGELPHSIPEVGGEEAGSQSCWVRVHRLSVDGLLALQEPSGIQVLPSPARGPTRFLET